MASILGRDSNGSRGPVAGCYGMGRGLKEKHGLVRCPFYPQHQRCLGASGYSDASPQVEGISGGREGRIAGEWAGSESEGHW